MLCYINLVRKSRKYLKIDDFFNAILNFNAPAHGRLLKTTEGKEESIGNHYSLLFPQCLELPLYRQIMEPH